VSNALLNEIPVLDKGYVALRDKSMGGDDLYFLCKDFRLKPTTHLLKLCRATIQIKCPLFVKLTLCRYELIIVDSNKQKLEAYVPSVPEIDAKDLDASERISADFKRTTEALLINPKAYQMEGCNTFISQVMSPISVYNEFVASGSLGTWLDFCLRDDLPGSIDAYREAIFAVLVAEWNQIKDIVESECMTRPNKKVCSGTRSSTPTKKQ